MFIQLKRHNMAIYSFSGISHIGHKSKYFQPAG